MLRRRQVRLSYPGAYTELTLLLADRHGIPATVHTLGIPLSTYYRWNKRRHELVDSRMEPDSASCDTRLQELIATCQKHGFDLRTRLACLEPKLVGSESWSDAKAGVNVVLFPANVTRRPLSPKLTGKSRLAAAHPPEISSMQEKLAALKSVQLEMDTRFYSRLSCAGLAQLAGMSRFAFIRSFKTAYGISPYRYLMLVRIRHAKRLLATSHQPLPAIAAAVGFDSQSLLSKAFCSIEGVSMARYFQGMRLGAGGNAVRPAPQHAMSTR